MPTLITFGPSVTRAEIRQLFESDKRCWVYQFRGDYSFIRFTVPERNGYTLETLQSRVAPHIAQLTKGKVDIRQVFYADRLYELAVDDVPPSEGNPITIAEKCTFILTKHYGLEIQPDSK